MKPRLDCFIIWPHAINNKLEIIDIIAESFDIIYIKHTHIKNMKKFIRKIYNFDYAPLIHLKSKTKYLESAGMEAFCIVVKNKEPELMYFDSGAYRHIECCKIKNKKTEIRDKFNPSINGKRTEEHVIHASDNEIQAIDIMNTFLVPKNITMNCEAGIYHINLGDKVIVKRLNIEEIYCFNFEYKGNKPYRSIKEIQESAQYSYLINDTHSYNRYLNNFIGIELCDYYSTLKFKKLFENFDIENYSPILVKKDSCGRYYILDGLHRACILKLKNINKIKVIIVE